MKGEESVCPKCRKSYLVYGRNGNRFKAVTRKRKGIEYLVQNVRCYCGWRGKEWYRTAFSHFSYK
jgi:hypothetical protein